MEFENWGNRTEGLDFWLTPILKKINWLQTVSLCKHDEFFAEYLQELEDVNKL
jgi:hypothetical protein